MPTQREDLDRAIAEARWRPNEFIVLVQDTGTKIMWKGAPAVWWCLIQRSAATYQITMRPGSTSIDERVELTAWQSATGPSVIANVHRWIDHVRREASVKGGDPTAPGWLLGALPSRYRVIEQELERLRTEQQEHTDMARLLWQTGNPLDIAVAGAFSAFGYKADPTVPGETYDLLVHFGDGRRLFVEVTGIDGAIAKDSRKVAQVLDTQQLADFDDEHDRVVVAANVFRKILPSDRREAPLTPNAAKILKGLAANVLLTPTLFEWWQQSLNGETEAVRRKVEALHALDGGLFIDPGAPR